MPIRCLVKAEVTESSGVTLYASEAVQPETVLLEVPLSECITSGDVSTEAAAALPERDTFGRLLLALLAATEAREPSPVATYFASVFDYAEAEESLMQLWPAHGPAADMVAHCVAWRRSRQERADIEAEHAALTAANLTTATLERYMWAKSLLRTRAFDLTSSSAGHALCPVLDLTNHRSTGAVARWQLAEVDGEQRMQSISKYALDAGDELSFCYDPECDFVDLFERYGFWDASSVVHTVEVVVPPAALVRADSERPGVPAEPFDGCNGEGEERAGDEGAGSRGDAAAWCDLVTAQAALGCSAQFDAWWVPDFNTESCPLYAAVRATLLDESEVRSGETPLEALRRPIAREGEAREHFAALLRGHLRGYACTVGQAGRVACSSGQPPGPEKAAAELVLYEQQLLWSVLQTLDDARGGSA